MCESSRIGFWSASQQPQVVYSGQQSLPRVQARPLVAAGQASRSRHPRARAGQDGRANPRRRLCADSPSRAAPHARTAGPRVIAGPRVHSCPRPVTGAVAVRYLGNRAADVCRCRRDQWGLATRRGRVGIRCSHAPAQGFGGCLRAAHGLRIFSLEPEDAILGRYAEDTQRIRKGYADDARTIRGRCADAAGNPCGRPPQR